VISDDLATFLESGVSILLGTRGPRLVPAAARGVGLRVEPGGEEVTVFLPAATAGATLANLRDAGRLAVCVSRARDHRSVQLKGRVVAVAEAGHAERTVVDRYRCALSAHWAEIGIPPRLTLRMAHWPCHAVRVRVEALFEQTPGPGAGAPLGGGRA
jgi:hypothetical protein